MPLSDRAERAAQRIHAARILPVLRAASADEAHRLVTRLLSAGVAAFELTTTIPDWADLLASVRTTTVDALIGMGTVLTAADAERALERGADFLVSPFPAPPVRPVAAAVGVLFVEGGLTPGELADAASRGVAKLFPAHVGGIAYLRSLRSVLPTARIVPTGGIAVDDVPAWLEAGAFAVGVGRDLYAAQDLQSRLDELNRALGQPAGGRIAYD